MKNLSRIVAAFISLTTIGNASFVVSSKVQNLNVYNSPFPDAKVISTKKIDVSFNVDYCNKYGWCKLSNNKGYIKEHKISKTQDLVVPTKVIVTPINRNIVDVKNSLEYKIALENFNKKDFQKSFLLFGELNDKYDNNEFIKFYYGRSAFEIKNYEYAFIAFDQILIENPDNNRVRAEYARTLMMMKSYKDAKKEFEKILLSPIPVNVRKNIEKMIALIDEKEKNYILNKIAILGFGWDDNIENNTYLSTTAYGNINLNNNTNKKKDTNFNAILVGNLIVPNKLNNNITWETTTVGYIQEQSKYKTSNIQLLSLSSGLGIKNKQSKNLFSLTYDHIWIDGTQTLYIYGATDNIKHNFNPYNQLSFTMKLKNKIFSDNKNIDKNSDIKEFSVEYTKTLDNKKDKINFLTTVISERKKQGTRTDVDKNTKKYKISYAKELISSLNLTVGYEKEKNNYLREINILGKRNDDKNSFSSKLAHKFDKKNIIDLEYNNINNKSNINTYSYKKQSVKINYTVIF